MCVRQLPEGRRGTNRRPIIIQINFRQLFALRKFFCIALCPIGLRRHSCDTLKHPGEILDIWNPGVYGDCLYRKVSV